MVQQNAYYFNDFKDTVIKALIKIIKPFPKIKYAKLQQRLKNEIPKNMFDKAKKRTLLRYIKSIQQFIDFEEEEILFKMKQKSQKKASEEVEMKVDQIKKYLNQQFGDQKIKIQNLKLILKTKFGLGNDDEILKNSKMLKKYFDKHIIIQERVKRSQKNKNQEQNQQQCTENNDRGLFTNYSIKINGENNINGNQYNKLDLNDDEFLSLMFPYRFQNKEDKKKIIQEMCNYYQKQQTIVNRFEFLQKNISKLQKEEIENEKQIAFLEHKIVKQQKA